MQLKGRWCVEIKYDYYVEANSREHAIQQVSEKIPLEGPFSKQHIRPDVSGENIYAIFTPVVTALGEEKWKKEKLNWMK